MSNIIKITEAVDIINDTVKPYEKTRPYLDTGALQLSDIKEIKHFSYNEKPSRANLNIKSGDLILARMQSTVKARLIIEEDEDLMISTGFLVLRPVKSIIEPTYLYHIITSPYFQNEKDRLCSGSTQKSINNSNFKKLSIPLPPLEEQKKVAAILDAADDYRQKTKALIDKYDQLTQSLFLDMFGDPVTNPMGWDVCLFEDVVLDMQNGIGKNKSFYGRGTKVANIGDLYPSYSFKPLKYSLLEVSENEIHKYRLKYGDLLFVRSSLKKEGVAFCSFYNSNEICLFSSFMIKASPDLTRLNPFFLSIQMRTYSYRKYLINAANTATITNISQPNLKSLNLSLPPLELQNLFAERVAQIEKQKHQAEASLVKAEELFNSLLQKAFKGELTN